MQHDARRRPAPCNPIRTGACRRGWLGALLVGAALAGPCAANPVIVSSNVAFTKINQNPWTSGDAFEKTWTYTPSVSFDVNLPRTGVTPWGLLSDYLGLPQIGFADATAHVAGSVGLNMGYAVDGGRMNIIYPGNASVSFAGPTHVAGLDYVAPGDVVHTTTAFTPGLTHTVVPPGSLSPFFNAPVSIPGFEFTSIQDPTFKTYFPTASAWAGLDYDLKAGFKVEAGLARNVPLVGCVLCFSRAADVEKKGHVEIANVNPAGVQLIGQDRIDLFGQEFALGKGKVRVDYPNVSVTGTLQADGSTLAGGSVASIFSFSGDLEKLIPFLGPFLHQAIGPFNVKLLGIAGGPGLGLYQDFSLDVHPRVELRFNQPVLWYNAGIPMVTTVIETTLGADVDWVPLVNTSAAPLEVQLVFKPEATIHNQTGFAVGYDLGVSALELGTPFGKLGPLVDTRLTDPGALKLPAFYDATFAMNLGDIAVDPVRFEAAPTISQGFATSSVAFALQGLAAVSSDGNLFDLTLVDTSTHAQYIVRVGGHFEHPDVPGGSGNDLIFVADGDVIVHYVMPNIDNPHANTVPVNLGTYFCVQCTGASATFMPVSQSFLDSASGDRLFVNDLGDIRSDSTNYLNDPDINRATYAVTSVDTVAIGPILPLNLVPEPTTLGVFGIGLGLLAALAVRRRRRDGGLASPLHP